MKAIKPACIGGKAHHMKVEAPDATAGSEMRGRCKRRGCHYSRTYSTRLAEDASALWNDRVSKKPRAA